ncbi:MAG: RNA-directed DNA polymerase [Actinomycetota bacterium]|nr:RNA-directed DNA polymerase [Actinomycetota bacterium]
MIPKPGGGARTLVHLSDRDRRRFETAVAAVTPRVERALSRSARANRAKRTATGIELEPWRHARRRFRRSFEVSAGPARAVFVGDVVDCYGSITTATVERALRCVGVPSNEIERIAQVLRGFHERGVRGLPIGPEPSAVLANAVLAPVDRALALASRGPVLRWVDDVMAFASTRGDATRAAAAFERALDDIGLVAHPHKTGIVDDREMLSTVASTGSLARARPRDMMRQP